MAVTEIVKPYVEGATHSDNHLETGTDNRAYASQDSPVLTNRRNTVIQRKHSKNTDSNPDAKQIII